MRNLRWKGKPIVGNNWVADELPDLCLCKFMGVGVPMDGRECKVHERGTKKYPCDYKFCSCSDYKPNKVKTSPGHWPLCTCTHLAQDHNANE